MLPYCVHGFDFAKNFIDPEDGYFDTSRFILENSHGFLPVPIIISEPAIDNGGGLGLVFFHETEEELKRRKKLLAEVSKKFFPPSMSVIAGGGTSNGTRFVGGGHISHLRDDSIRSKTLGGYADVNISIYDIGRDILFDDGLPLNAEVLFLNQEIMFRLGSSSWWAGSSYTFLNLVNSFNEEEAKFAIKEREYKAKDAFFSAILRYESVANRFAPEDGFDVTWKVSQSGNYFGGDFEYTQLSLLNRYYHNFTEKLILGLRWMVMEIEWF